MSERKVLTKYYPPDFDPSAIARTRRPKDTGPKLQTVRLMAPFSGRCSSCSEFIYKGRKFNARKETTDEKYYGVPIYRFYIRCTRCSAELTFKTDPKNTDYTCEKGWKRNFEPWREAKLAEETEAERLDRLEREEAERDAMAELETKALDAKQEMAIADSLDRIRMQNAKRERASGMADINTLATNSHEHEEEQTQDDEDTREMKAVLYSDDGKRIRRLAEDDQLSSTPIEPQSDGPTSSWIPAKKRKRDHGAELGIKKKRPVSLV